MNKEPQTPIAGRTGTEAMIDAEIVTYTSLRDVLPPSMASPTSAAQESISGGRRMISGGASIRNPLVMQAALAYLQPLGVGGGRQLFGGYGGGLGRHQCGGCVGCFNGVVLAVLRRVFGKRVRGADDDDDDEDEDD